MINLLWVGLSFIGGFLGSIFDWTISRAGQRFLILVAWMGIITIAVTTLDGSIRSAISSVSQVVPDLGYFYTLFMPDNFPAFITTIMAIELSLMVYKWAYKIGSAKAGVS